MSEREWIRWLRRHAPDHPHHPALAGASRFAQRIGDDAAILPWSSSQSCLSCADMLLDGVHFDSSDHDLQRIGRKALAVNLSDIAAMGGTPKFALVTIALPRNRPELDPRELYAGLFRLSKAYEVAVVGGDTTSWENPLAISVTVIGEPGRRTWCRDGARPGDRILVSGPLGGSILGKHLDFEPRLSLASRLNQRWNISSAIDLSDGLASDLGHICEASQFGAVIDADRVPISAPAFELARKTGREPLQHALGDGEDFELLLTVPGQEAQELLKSSDDEMRLYDIGEITTDPQVKLVDPSGHPIELDVDGFEHRFSFRETDPSD